MSDTPNQVRVALGVLVLHGEPVTEQEYRKLLEPLGCTVTAGYLMMQGYLRATQVGPAGGVSNSWQTWVGKYMRHYELTERGLEALR